MSPLSTTRIRLTQVRLAGGRLAGLVFIIAAIIGLTMTAGCQSPLRAGDPSIEFTVVPEASEGGPEQLQSIAGRVAGAREGQQIVLYARSGVWWVQPLKNQPFTPIQSDSSWNNVTHLGTEYAALLVDPGYRPPPRLDAMPKPGGQVMAVALAKGKATTPAAPNRTLHFSGYEWEIRHIASDRGGAPQVYDAENAFTDAQGMLHLRIARRNDRWTCAEVKLTRSLGYGTYAFVVHESSHLEPAAVLGLFTWDDGAGEENHREIDVELTQWGNPDSQNAQYVVQPYYVPANVARFAVPPGVMTHAFRWEPGRVIARTVRGADLNAAPANRRPVAEHTFTSGVPAPGAETVRINLYIFGSASRPLKNETEVVIEKFQYLP